MTLPQPLAPKPKAVTINGQPYKLVAFYYPDKDMPWDLVFQGQFLANFYPCSITLTIDGSTATFNNSEAAFQATKWWHSSDRKKFEAAVWPHVTGSEAFNIKNGLPNPDYSYAGLGSYEAMKAVLTAKFSDHVLKQALLLTGDAYLLEHNVPGRKDPGGWSDLHDGSGANLLGKALMEVRAACGGVGAPSGTYSVADFTAHAEK
ncbi:MAG: NADAR family protein [Pyrinomonadaceae bacterium]